MRKKVVQATFRHADYKPIPPRFVLTFPEMINNTPPPHQIVCAVKLLHKNAESYPSARFVRGLRPMLFQINTIVGFRNPEIFQNKHSYPVTISQPEDPTVWY